MLFMVKKVLSETGIAKTLKIVRSAMGNEGGSYAVIFAVSLVPVLIALGAAIDLSQAYLTKSRMMSALDAAGLAVAGMTGQSTTQIQKTAQDFFDANYPEHKIGTPGEVSVAVNGNKLTLSANATMETAFLGIIGVRDIKIGASSEITRMGKKLEVALVLDTTGSMSGEKLNTLKQSAKDLIDTVSASALNPDDVRIAIVPFAVDVNLAGTGVSDDWIKWNWTTPKYRRCDWVWVPELKPNGKPHKNKGEYVYICEDYSYSISQRWWSGCVIDRDMNYDISTTPPVAGNDATLYPADDESCTPQPINPLTSDWAYLKRKIDSLTAGGNTNTTIGMVWGWTMLTRGAALSTAAAPAENLDKVIVFLTDGDNTENRFTFSQAEIDDRTASLCRAIKASNVIIYTVRVINGNQLLLKECSSDAAKYYSAQKAGDLKTVFASIATSLSNLRLSR